jgi:transposase
MEKKKGIRPRERRTFSAEFKAEAVRLMEERRAEGTSLRQLGRELDVHPDRLRAWGREAAADRAGHRPGLRPPSSLEAEVRRLERENAGLRQERDFAKKAAAFFAKESR